ncbi:MAG: hypothetical protein ACI4DN_05025 [Lachnospiraceae bacterium]
MSYCVNCGVKLEPSLKTCPLCHTPVINPNDPHTQIASCTYSAFPEKRGEVELARQKDAGIWLTIVLFTSAVTCLLLNLTTFQNVRWSYPVVGACILLWIFICPKMLYTQLPWSLCLAADALCIIGYEYFLSTLTLEGNWFYELALPITLMAGAAVLVYILLYRYVSRAVLSTVLYFFIEAGLLNVGIELLIDHYHGLPLRPGWSAIVFSVCLIISVALITILSVARLRNTVRKRLHF